LRKTQVIKRYCGSVYSPARDWLMIIWSRISSRSDFILLQLKPSWPLLLISSNKPVLPLSLTPAILKVSSVHAHVFYPDADCVSAIDVYKPQVTDVLSMAPNRVLNFPCRMPPPTPHWFWRWLARLAMLVLLTLPSNMRRPRVATSMLKSITLSTDLWAEPFVWFLAIISYVTHPSSSNSARRSLPLFLVVSLPK